MQWWLQYLSHLYVRMYLNTIACIPKVITFLRPILSCGTCTNFRFKKCTVKYSVFSVVYVHSASAYLINSQDLSVEKIKWGQKAINGEYFLYCFSFGRPPTPSKKESVYNGLSRSWCLVTLADLYMDFWKSRTKRISVFKYEILKERIRRERFLERHSNKPSPF